MWEAPSLRDPLEAIGPLCSAVVLACLGSRDLARCGAVSRIWRDRALLDEQLWAPHLAQLWRGKVYVPAALRQLAQTSPRRAFAGSLADSKRHIPTEEELCSFTWTLQFKAISWFSASLVALALRRYYNPNHTVTAPPDDPLWGSVEPQRHYWFFRAGPDGTTVLQVNTYPCLEFVRTADWGWELHNPVVRMAIDAAAGPNPGIPPGHPAAAEALTVEQIEARFNALLLLGDLVEDEDSIPSDDSGPYSGADDEEAVEERYGGDKEGDRGDGEGLG